MLAFHGLEAERQEAIAKMKRHIAADELMQGYGYWKDGKGCMLGCLTETNIHTHARLEEMYNIPESIGLLCDRMFETAPVEDAKAFPLLVLESMQVGADLTHIASRFVVFVLEDVKHYSYTDGVAAINTCIALYERIINNDEPTAQEWSAARDAAESAAASVARNAAWSAAANVAWNAAESVAASVARNAARSAAANVAWNAAESAAESVAASVPRNAAENAARSAARSAAWSAAWLKYRDQLIRLLKGE